MPGGNEDEKLPNLYKDDLESSKPGLDSTANSMATRLDTAKSTFQSGAWLGGASDDFSSDLTHEIDQLDISADIAKGEIPDQVGVEPEKVDEGDWRATWAR